MADEGDPVDVEDGEQVAHSVGVRGNRVIGARLVGQAVAEKIRGDHQVVACQQRDHLFPGARVVADAMNQQQGRAFAGHSEGTAIAVNEAVTDRNRAIGEPAGVHVVCDPQHENPDCWAKINRRLEPSGGMLATN